MTKRYLGNIITQNPTAPAGDLANSAAKGVWSLEEQLAYQKAGLWPVPGNFPLDVEDVFSTYLYTGNGSTQTITNGIDLSGEGGLTWIKNRSASSTNHSIFDSESGATGGTRLRTNLSNGLQTFSGSAVYTTSSTGFALNNVASNDLNDSIYDYVSWTFRKAPKFFDCVTWTGDGVAGREISHSLGAVPGVMIIKKTSATEQWAVYHRSEGNTKYGLLDQTDAFSTFSGAWNNTTPTDTVFTVGNWAKVNQSGQTYVAYLFAHNDGDGGFGADGDADIIKCGSYTGNASNSAGPIIDLGFEPQWVMIKSADSAYDWFMADTMRGWTATHPDDDNLLRANSSAAETANSEIGLVNSTGFQIMGGGAEINGNGQTYIYIAIRRGTKVPESATEVFAIDTAAGTSPTPPTFVSGFPVDFSFYKNVTDSSNNWGSQNRLTGDADLAFNTTSAEFINGGTYWEKDYMNGIGSNTGINSNGYQWMWKRAPGYFDAVAFSGTGVAGRTVSHNLTVAPEMMWIKCRSAAESWAVYHAGITNPEQNYLYLDESSALNPNGNTIRYWNNTNPTDSVFTVGTEDRVNGSGKTYIAYLFATLPGISKVGSYTGNGGTQTIDCGFTSGAKFVIVKATDGGNWFVFDTDRGITSSGSESLRLNLTTAELSVSNAISPDSSGFIVEASYFNNSGDTYIFYAIA